MSSTMSSDANVTDQIALRRISSLKEGLTLCGVLPMKLAPYFAFSAFSAATVWSVSSCGVRICRRSPSARSTVAV